MSLFYIIVYSGTTHIINVWDSVLVCSGGYVEPPWLAPETGELFNKCVLCSRWLDDLVSDGGEDRP